MNEITTTVRQGRPTFNGEVLLLVFAQFLHFSSDGRPDQLPRVVLVPVAFRQRHAKVLHSALEVQREQLFL